MHRKERLTTTQFIKLLAEYKNTHASDTAAPIQLAKVFSSYLHGNLLFLENINFSALGSVIENLDFRDCVLQHCDFSFTEIKNCHFHDTHFENIKLHRAHFWQCSNVPPSFVQLENAESIEQCRKRVLHWINYHVKKTGLLFDYDLIDHWKNLNLVIQHGNFYNYPSYYDFYFGGKQVTSTHGWKMHISVAFDQVKEALRLIGPDLAFYCFFKVIDYDYFTKTTLPTDERFKESAHFTIYLEENNEVKPCEEVQQLIISITKKLRAHNIIAGVIPDSDAATFSEYCSIRNDFLHFDGSYNNEPFDFISIQKRLKSPYLYAASGMHFNYTNRPNPYSLLLTVAPACNTPAYHCEFLSSVRQLKGVSKSNLSVYIVGALTAFLEKYSHITSLTKNLYRKHLLFAIHQPMIDPSMIRDEHIKEKRIGQSIKICLLLLDFFVNGCHGDLNKMNCHFSTFIRAESPLKELLVAIDKALSPFPTHTSEDYIDYIRERDQQLKGQVVFIYKSFFSSTNVCFPAESEQIEDEPIQDDNVNQSERPNGSLG